MTIRNFFFDLYLHAMFGVWVSKRTFSHYRPARSGLAPLKREGSLVTYDTRTAVYRYFVEHSRTGDVVKTCSLHDSEGMVAKLNDMRGQDQGL